jgi:uncharacterized protein YegL
VCIELKKGEIKMIKDIVFILDRSGSMSGLEEDTIGGFNGLIKQQKQVEGSVYVTTVLFDDSYEILHDRVPLEEIQPLTEKEYYTRGTTALLDAIGKTIQKLSNDHKKFGKEKADDVLMVITTDGQENASRKYHFDVIQTLIQTYQNEVGWTFLFLGANIDSIKTASSIGIPMERTVNYHADRKGVKTNFDNLNFALNEFRSSQAVSEKWKENIDNDFKSRNKK